MTRGKFVLTVSSITARHPVEIRKGELRMAYDGELVKMANGRWARFQRCQVYRPGVRTRARR